MRVRYIYRSMKLLNSIALSRAFRHAAATLAAALPWVSTEAREAGKPNIVLVFTDDQGWLDLGRTSDYYETPNLDALARQGVVFTDAYASAGNYLANPTAPVGGGLSFFPLPGALSGAPADLSGLAGFLDYDRDFNGSVFDPVFRGAYSGEGANPGWLLALERKPEPPSAPAPPADFFALPPCRVIDTRNPTGPFGGPSLFAGLGRTFALADGSCAIPASARALSVNVTVTQPTAPGNLRLHPAGTAVPTVSSLNYGAAQTRGNNAIVPLSSTAGLAIYCAQASGTAHVIVDVNGYFE